MSGREVQDFDVEPSGQRFAIDLGSPDPAPIAVLANRPALLRDARPR
jgi:hypothetical protein